jgi:hypothetical protein
MSCAAGIFCLQNAANLQFAAGMGRVFDKKIKQERATSCALRICRIRNIRRIQRRTNKMKHQASRRILAVLVAAAACILLRTGWQFWQARRAAQEPAPFSDASQNAATQADRPALVRVKGRLYRDTGEVDAQEGRCGMMDGSIQTQTSGGETPIEDDQSNFGAGYGYQYGRTDDQIEVLIDGAWHIFAATA